MSVDLAKLNRPGVMSSYSSSGRKNTVHASKGQVAGSTFNSARMQAASKFLEPSKGGHVAAKRMFSNAAPRYWNGQEMSMQMNRSSGQISSFQSNNFISGGFNPMGMGNMFGMGMDPTVGTIMGLTNIGMSLLDKFGVFGGKQVQVQSAGQQLDSVINTATTLTTDNVNFEGVSKGISDAINSGNPDDLSKAITSGHNKLAAMDGMTSTYENAAKAEEKQITSMKGKLSKAIEANITATNNMNEIGENVTKAKGNVDKKKNDAAKFGKAYNKANSDYIDAHKDYLEAQNKTKVKQAAFDNASKTLSAAESSLANATQNAIDATNAYNAEPATDKNGNPNPKKDQLRAKMNLAIEQKNKAKEDKDAAEKAKSNAEKELELAKGDETKAMNNENTKKIELAAAKENVKDANNELPKYEKELEAEIKALDDANNDLSRAQVEQQNAKDEIAKLESDIKSTNGASELLKAHKENRAKLADELQKGEVKLKELQSKQKTDKPSEGNPLQQLGHKITEQEQEKLGQPTDRFTHDGKDYKCYKGNIYVCNGSIIAKQTFDRMKPLAN